MSDYTGMYRGAVHDVNDPESRGRLRILVPAALGASPSGWAEPALPSTDSPAWAVGDRVWVLFEGGSINRPVYISRMVIGADDIPNGAITQEKLDGALLDLIEDTGINIFFGDFPDPVDPEEGDLWHKDDGTMERYDGFAWAPFTDPAIEAALVAAAAAADLADGKVAIYFAAGGVSHVGPTLNNQGVTLGTADTGDLWYETDNEYKAYRWTGSAWVAYALGSAALAVTIQNTLAASITSFSGTTLPVSPKNGDMWLRPENVATAEGSMIEVHTLYRFDSARTPGTEPGSQWIKSDDPLVQQALINAQAAANLADSKVRVFADNKHPTKFAPASDPVMTDADVGDLWIRLDEGNKNYRYDGADQGWVSAQSTSTNEFTVLTRLALTGAGNEIAKDAVVTVQSGVTPPAAPQVLSTYTVNNIHEGFAPRGMGYHAAGDRYVSMETVFSATMTATSVDPTTKDNIWAYGYDLTAARSEVQSGMGGVVVIGNSAYALCQTTEAVPGTFLARWYVYKINWSSGTTWTYNSRWLYEPSGSLGGNSTWRPAIGIRGSNLVIAQANAGGSVKVSEYSTSGVLQGSIGDFVNVDTSNFTQSKHCSGVVVSSADVGSERYWVTFEGRNTAYAFTSGKLRDVNSDFALPTSNPYGLMWDSALATPRFRTRTGPNIYRFSGIKDSDFSSNALNLAITWRNATTGSETAHSPAFVSTTFPRRSNLMIVSDTIPNDTANATDPDAVGFYVARGTSPTRTSYHRATTAHTVAGQQVLVLEDLPPGTNAVPPDPTTTPFPAATPGVFKSAALLGGDPSWSLKGDGSVRIADVLEVDAAGNDLLDTGWVSGWAAKGASTPFPNNASTVINYAEYRIIGKTAHVRISVTAGAAYNPANADHANQSIVTGLPTLAQPSVNVTVAARMAETPVGAMITTGGVITWTGSHSNSPNFLLSDTMVIDAHYFLG